MNDLEHSIKEQPGSEYTQDNSSRYKRLFRLSLILMTIVAVAPLIILAIVNIYQYQKAFKADIAYPLSNQTLNTKNSLSSFIDERLSALKFISKEKSFEDLSNKDNLFIILRHLKESFDGFIDLGIIDENGVQISYVGPYQLLGKNYNNQRWYNETIIKGEYISDVFMGYRGLPHFTLAVTKETSDNKFFIIRATINSEKLFSIIKAQKLLPTDDAFLINNNGILQTSSKYNGEILTKWTLPTPSFSTEPEVIETKYKDNNYFLAYSYIENTPFILIETTDSESVMSNWRAARNNLITFLVFSILVIVASIFWGTYRLIRHIKRSDIKLVKFLRNVSYTNKLATIGRLAAGVSHEINNPLSIINENAGVIHDLLINYDDYPLKDKILNHINSIVKSVDRCSRITHRLLGFARRMEVQIDNINILELIKEVISFVEREIHNNNINININEKQSNLFINSDKGQLQQVFLNIINNAIDAVNSGGSINIEIDKEESELIKITIKDNGVGISKENVDKIFDPFYSSKNEQGTGLGLFITYGIIQKLGGQIKVKTDVGIGTAFIILLPINHNIYQEQNGNY